MLAAAAVNDKKLRTTADYNQAQTAAHTYIGEMLLLAGKTAEAKVHFDWVKSNGEKYGDDEYRLAKAELKRISDGPKATASGTRKARAPRTTKRPQK